MEIFELKKYIKNINTNKEDLKALYDINSVLKKVQIHYDTSKTNSVVICGASDPEMEIIKVFCTKMGIKVIDKDCTPGQVYGQIDISKDEVGDSHIVYIEFKPKNMSELTNSFNIIDHHNPGDPGYGEDKKHYAFSSLGQFIYYFNIGFNESTYNGAILKNILIYSMAADHCLSDVYDKKYEEISMVDFLEYRMYIKAKHSRCSFEAVKKDYENTIEYIVNSNMKFKSNDQLILVKQDSENAKYLNEICAMINMACVYTMPLKEGGIKLGIIGSNYENTKEFMDIMQMYKKGEDTLYGNPHRGYAGLNIKDSDMVDFYLLHAVTHLYKEEEQTLE